MDTCAGIESYIEGVVKKLYDQIYIVDTAAGVYEAYAADGLQKLDSGDYRELVSSLAAKMSELDTPIFLPRMELSSIQEALKERQVYSVECLIRNEDGPYRFVFDFMYVESDPEHIIALRHGSASTIALVDIWRHEEARLNFLMEHLCEDFMEVDVDTGKCVVLCPSGMWEDKGVFSEQVAWWAENLIAPEEKEQYLEEFRMDNLLRAIREHNGIFTVTHTGIVGAERRSLMILSALYKEPSTPSKQYIFSFAQDITEALQQEERNRRLVDISQQLLDISQKDVLTGLLNRSAAEKQVIQCLGRNHPGTMLLIDIDHFKEINDTYGHQAGDIVLKYMAKHMDAAFRLESIVARWGGDEFIVFIQNVSDKELIAGRIAALRARMHECIVHGKPLPVTFSVGGAAALRGQSFQTLFAICDKNLYEVKTNGRDHYKIDGAYTS